MSLILERGKRAIEKPEADAFKALYCKHREIATEEIWKRSKGS
jgi:hypothetical protein